MMYEQKSARNSASMGAKTSISGLCNLILAIALLSSCVIQQSVAAKELDFRGPSGYLYANCEGHCSYNWQCSDDLECYKRKGDMVPVPGCTGLGTEGVDYCHDPKAPMLVAVDETLVAENEDQEEQQDQDELLEKYKDDADDGEDEQDILFGTTPKADDMDDSGTVAEPTYDPIKAAKDGIIPDSTAVTYVGTNIPLKLGKCQGKCNSDSHCREGLRCLNLPGQTYIPGCDGEREDTGISVCYDPKEEIVWDVIPEDSETLLYVGKLRTKDYSKQLGKCMGDCRVDNDCRGDLECYENDGSSVPGCLGVRVKGVDYCHDPNDRKSGNALSYIAQNPEYDMGHCEGNCNSDSDCFSYLVCYNDPNSEKVPGCPGERLTGIDYCVHPDHWSGYVPETTTTAPKPAVADTSIGNVPPAEAAAEEKTQATPSTPEEVGDGDAEQTEAQVPPPSSNLDIKPSDTTSNGDQKFEDPQSYEPYKPPKISIGLPPIHVAMNFNSPERVRRLSVNRILLINENIDEEGDLLAIIAGLLGEGIRRLGPTSYAGMLLDVAFVDEVEEKGMTTVTYEFSGSSIFHNNDDFVQPSPRLMEAAALDILDTDVIYDALTQSGNPVLQAVQSVSVTTPEEEEADVTKQGSEEPSSGIKTGVIVLVVIMILICLVVGGAFLFKRRNKQNFWKRPGEGGKGGNKTLESKSSSSSNDKSTPSARSSPSKKKKIVEAFSSPTRTKKTDINTPPCTPDVDPDMMPDVSLHDNDESSIGGDSNWSFTGRNFGYSASEMGDGNSSIGSKKKPSELITTIAEDGGGQCGSSVNSESLGNSSVGGMSMLSDVHLNNVLKIEDNRTRTWESVDTMSSTFKNIWKQSEEKSIDGILSLEPARSHSPAAEEKV